MKSATYAVASSATSDSDGPQRAQCFSITTPPSRRTTRPSSAAPHVAQLVNSCGKNVWGSSRRPDGETQVVHSMAIPPTTTTKTPTDTTTGRPSTAGASGVIVWIHGAVATCAGGIDGGAGDVGGDLRR